jgi:hypothetical protein
MDKTQEQTDLQHDFVRAAQAAMEQQNRKGRELTDEEDRKMQDGFALEEMMHSAGWSIVQDILQNMPKANIDPRGLKEEEWKFAQLNAFWQGTVAAELLQGLYDLIGQAHQLQRIKLGEVQDRAQRMKL